MEAYFEMIAEWTLDNSIWAFVGVLVISLVLYQIVRFMIGKVLVSIAERTETKYDDLIVDSLRPFRIAWLAPLVLIYFFSRYVFPNIPALQVASVFITIWVVNFTVVSLLDGINEIYEMRPNYNGVSIQGYLDIVKILTYIVAIILSISVVTGESPLILLSGIGALTAVLLLVFRDTILSVVASMQIAANDLVKEGDWIEVPSYNADGDVVNMTLHSIKIKNFDQTTTVIPTYKMADTAFRNYRSMQQSGGRKIQRSLHIDLSTIKFCSDDLLEKLQEVDLIGDLIRNRKSKIKEFTTKFQSTTDWPLDGPMVTNLEIFREYILAYVRARGDIHTDDFTLMIRDRAPSPSGLPLEIYAFTRTTVWSEYEEIQSSIFNHLIAAMPIFELQPFQSPSGKDFSTLTKN